MATLVSLKDELLKRVKGLEEERQALRDKVELLEALVEEQARDQV